MSDLRAILFDMDGVLLDSIDCWHGVVNEVRSDLSLPSLSRDDVLAIFGQGVEDDVRNLYPGQRVEDIRRRYDESMPRHLHHMRVTPDAVHVLTALGRRGLGRAVVTNTQATLARSLLARTGLAAHLDVVAAAGEGQREKPHPDLVLHALDRLGVPPREACLVGDTDYDERAARAAGVEFLFFDVRGGDSLSERLRPYL